MNQPAGSEPSAPTAAPAAPSGSSGGAAAPAGAGGTPPGQTDKVHSVRTGICLTRENFIAYFYGTEIAAEVLAQAMIRARCKFGIHLDMNVGHTGLEFYRVAPAPELPGRGAVFA